MLRLLRCELLANLLTQSASVMLYYIQLVCQPPLQFDSSLIRCAEASCCELSRPCSSRPLGFPQDIADANIKHGQANRSRYIDALANEPKLVTYSDDGAADATVTEVGSNALGIVENPVQSVRDIVNLGAGAIPLLIAHLER
jgi:hypothetical protein